jgi:hypothetical protein
MSIAGRACLESSSWSAGQPFNRACVVLIFRHDSRLACLSEGHGGSGRTGRRKAHVPGGKQCSWGIALPARGRRYDRCDTTLARSRMPASIPVSPGYRSRRAPKLPGPFRIYMAERVGLTRGPPWPSPLRGVALRATSDRLPVALIEPLFPVAVGSNHVFIGTQTQRAPKKTRGPLRLGMAERVGFEPTVRSRVQRFSRPPRSTTPAPLQRSIFFTARGRTSRLSCRIRLCCPDADRSWSLP